MSDDFHMTEQAFKMNMKERCLDLAARLVFRDQNGEACLTKDDMLEAAKDFYEFINAP